MRRRGMSLIEVVVATALVAFCLLAFLSVATTSLREATRTRSEILADEALLNTFEEIFGSHFGAWKAGHPEELDIDVVVEGRRVLTQFTRTVEVAKEKGGTGAFFGQVQGEFDVVKVTLNWTEGTASESAGANKTKVAYLTVWKRPGGR